MARIGRVVNREDRDVTILCAIMGVDKLSQINMVIEEGYLMRERMENLRESGYEVPEDFQPRERGELERNFFRSLKLLEGLERDRTKRTMEWDEQDIDLDLALENYIPEPPRERVEIL